MTSARDEVHRDLVLALQAQTVNRHVALARLGVGGVAHAHGDVGAGVLFGVGGSRDELADIEIGIVCLVDDLLANGLVSPNVLHGDGVLDSVVEQEAQAPGVAIEQMADARTAGEHTDGNASARMALHVVEDHRRALFGRTHNGAARTDMTIHTRELGAGLDLDISRDQLTRDGLQKLNSATEISDLICHVYLQCKR